jgi:FMN phosphatase YigB (HAD superfamily)
VRCSPRPSSRDQTAEPTDRIATFDYDGTLWCEKPSYVQADFFLRRMREMIEAKPELAKEQPFKAIAEKAMAEAAKRGWMVVSMKDDWKRERLANRPCFAASVSAVDQIARRLVSRRWREADSNRRHLDFQWWGDQPDSACGA